MTKTCLAKRQPALALSHASLLALAFGAPGLALAQTGTKTGAVATVAPVVVTATRTPTPLDEVASSITLITADEIEQHQWRTLPDALRSVPGLHVVQTGGPGGQTSVFIRGTNSNHVKVLIDGVEANDPSSNDAFDFGQLQLDDVARVEVLRGPQSGLYGSDAIGGVINIITKSAGEKTQVDAKLEGGSQGTFNQTARISGRISPRVGYAFDVAHFRSDDTPVTPTALLAPGEARHDDSYDNLTGSGRIEAQVTDTFKLGATARYTDSHLKFTNEDYGDFSGPALPAYAQSRQENRELFSAVTGDLNLFQNRFENHLSLGYTDYRDREADPYAEFFTPPTYTRGNRIDLNYQGDVHLAPGETLVFGAEDKQDRLTDSPISAHNSDRAGFVELESQPLPGLSTSASVRYDSYTLGGERTTYHLAPSYTVAETGTQLKATYGTGFKTPSLTQLFVSDPGFDFFANPDLKPERSEGWDAGFEQPLLANRVRVGATYFHNNIRDLIDINDAFTMDINVDRARTSGVEAFTAFQLSRRVDLRVDYTYTIAKDASTGLELERRPIDKLTLTGAWRPTDRLSLSTSWLYVSRWIDGNRDFSIPRLEASPYFTLDLAGEYRLSRRLALFARIDNLLDRRYEDPVGFQRPGFGAFGGVRLRL